MYNVSFNCFRVINGKFKSTKNNEELACTLYIQYTQLSKYAIPGRNYFIGNINFPLIVICVFLLSGDTFNIFETECSVEEMIKVCTWWNVKLVYNKTLYHWGSTILVFQEKTHISRIYLWKILFQSTYRMVNTLCIGLISNVIMINQWVSKQVKYLMHWRMNGFCFFI